LPISNVPVQLWIDGRLAARGMCHLIERHGSEAGTVSGLTWTAEERDLTGRSILLRMANGRDFQVMISRHSRPEGRTILRFTGPG